MWILPMKNGGTLGLSMKTDGFVAENPSNMG